jgi:phage terminase Nu1 subunit (DNA packaging protein)
VSDTDTAIPRLLTPEELGEILGGLSNRTLQDWRRQGIGPDFVTLSGKMVRYRPQAVDRWIRDRERNAKQVA